MSQKIRILLPDGGVERVDEGYKREYDDEWYDQYAYDRDGWDRRGFNIYGLHRITKDYFDQHGLDEWLFDRHGINHGSDTVGVVVGKKENIFWHPWDMVCEFNSIGIHKITHTPFNECWLNWKGIDKQGNRVMTKKCASLCEQFNLLYKKIEQLTKEHQKLVALKDIQVRKKAEEVIKECEGRKKEFELKIKELQKQRENLEKELSAAPSLFALKKPEWKPKFDSSEKLKLEIQQINDEISQEDVFVEYVWTNERRLIMILGISI